MDISHRGGRGGRGLSAHGWGQKSIQTNTASTRFEKNATMSPDTCVQEAVVQDEPNTDISQRRRGLNIIEQVPHDSSKRTMISLDGGEYAYLFNYIYMLLVILVLIFFDNLLLVFQFSLCRFTDPKVSRKITSILKTMFNGSWTTWKEVDKSACDELWVHFKVCTLLLFGF